MERSISLATKYQVIRHVTTEELKWTSASSDLSDFIWVDSGVTADTLSRMQLFQKINHFPGMHVLTRKNHLAWTLSKIQKLLPEEFNFFPKTWVLPADSVELKHTSHRPFIVKPEAGSQGRGIYIAPSISNINLRERLVVQEYVSNPYLIDGHKFDLRVYALVSGVDPLRVYVHKEGLARLAVEEYSPNDFSSLFRHLTNYSINRKHENFEASKHKLSLKSVLRTLKTQGHDTSKIMSEISEIIMKTLCAACYSIAHVYQCCKPEDITKSMCFQILGFDILLDSELKPWLLEVNSAPSFGTSSEIDWAVKRRVIFDSLMMVNINIPAKLRNKKRYGMSKEDKEIACQEAQSKISQWEEENIGRFKKVSLNHQHILNVAKNIWSGRPKTVMRKSRIYKETSSSFIARNPPVPNEPRSSNTFLVFPLQQGVLSYGYNEQAQKSFSNEFSNGFRAKYIQRNLSKRISSKAFKPEVSVANMLLPADYQSSNLRKQIIRPVYQLKNPSFSKQKIRKKLYS